MVVLSQVRIVPLFKGENVSTLRNISRSLYPSLTFMPSVLSVLFTHPPPPPHVMSKISVIYKIEQTNIYFLEVKCNAFFLKSKM